MLSLPDFTEKKILFIFPEKDIDSQLRFGNSNLKLFKNNVLENQVSLHLLICIFIIGECTLTTYLIRQFRDHGISVFFLNKSFKYYASIIAEAEGNTEIRSMQYLMSPDLQLEFAKIVINNKVTNQYKLIQNYIKTQPNFKIEQATDRISKTTNLDELRGVEGSVASLYFKQIFEEHKWYRRAPTTKEDITNVLLDIGYTFLLNLTDSLLRLFGFDTYKGFFHTLYFQRKSLSCDVMEPARSIIDKALLKAYALQQINEKDFTRKKGYFEFKNWEVQRKYIAIFSNAIMDSKDEIYEYVLSWYRYFHDQKKYSPPDLIITF